MALRIPTDREVEQIRLILSAYQDGSGMLTPKSGTTLPGWRDFERTVAIVFHGEAQENKAIFDVLVQKAEKPTTRFGISCKMRRELNKLTKTGRVTLELSNSAGKFWNQLRLRNLNQKNYLKKPRVVGKALISLVEDWHSAVSIKQGGVVDLDESFYLVLSWNREGFYQLHQFTIRLPEPESLRWYFPSTRCLKGDDKQGALFEWYGQSGGQLKYYPLAKTASWSSRLFRLEPIRDEKVGILSRTSSYFPTLWEKVVSRES